ncbi:uncharacterized protein K452DRAFT_61329 [Aplosporella prunicola CBS 121167]|uniref:Uncharacterized protein n=1 Tax=Aplosporella prunicola CBS 121167 TaxID=1176127 RepID=A0A6A6B9B2_9PEZI|nr:uncharacterized protein K452DRAFT_61329 [Aplosporella prunicola CBS 121167]KAF2139497.1 hypothetical protein K452DRAFT_61329 [Aplosporella prunicola CBS 121167]
MPEEKKQCEHLLSCQLSTTTRPTTPVGKCSSERSSVERGMIAETWRCLKRSPRAGIVLQSLVLIFGHEKTFWCCVKMCCYSTVDREDWVCDLRMAVPNVHAGLCSAMLRRLLGEWQSEAFGAVICTCAAWARSLVRPVFWSFSSYLGLLVWDTR